MKVIAERLNSGRYIVRPSGSLGTCGYSPFPWDAGVGSSEKSALTCFIRNNQKYVKNLNVELI